MPKEVAPSEDQNGHKLDPNGELVFDERCRSCDAPMTDEQKIAYLAEMMGWHKVKARGNGNRDVYIWATRDRDQNIHWDFASEIDWNPLTDWNHWRQVELEMMETGWRGSLRSHFLEQFENIAEYIEADLPTKVSRLIAAHQSLHP
jgi:hypothetical protein